MILPMSKVRILGPRGLLAEVLPILQDFGQLHLTPPRESEGMSLVRPSPADEHKAEQLRRILGVVRSTLEDLGRTSQPKGAVARSDRSALTRWARLGRSVGREARAIRTRISGLEEERAFLARYRQFFGSFQALAEAASQWPGAAAYHVVLPDGGGRSLARLKDGLRAILGEQFEIWSREIDTGEIGVLILVPRTASEPLEELFAAVRVQEVELPGTAEGLSTAEAIPRIVRRYDAIPAELRGLEASLARLAREHGATLTMAEASLVDELARLEAVVNTAATDHAFVLEGWLPSSETSSLRGALRRAVGATGVVEEVSREEWVGEDVPVVLNNPRLFRPFETVVGILPLPRYGTIDPTPFLAIFFPMFFGVVLGDVGYGLILAGLALWLRHRFEAGSKGRALAEIAGACAAFTVIFGFFYGELFGDAGARLLGMRALVLRREEALLPFLGLALAIGVVHTLLGLVLDVISKLRQGGGRAAVGSGVTLLMVALVVLAILAAVDVLPGAFFTPVVLVVLVLFPVLVVVEGILGPTELLSTLGHILSYARVMAVGTASVMMAIAANRMIGAMGSVLVGSLFALLFHLVNFALGVFSPTVHALRLHFVEFFGTFYSPGGTKYEPFGHWAAPRRPQPRQQ